MMLFWSVEQRFEDGWYSDGSVFLLLREAAMKEWTDHMNGQEVRIKGVWREAHFTAWK